MSNEKIKQNNNMYLAIDSFREKQGLNWKQWGEKAGVPLTTLYNFKNGYSDSLGYAILKKLANSAGTTVDAMLGVSGFAEPPQQKFKVMEIKSHETEAFGKIIETKEVIKEEKNIIAIRYSGPSIFNEGILHGQICICNPDVPADIGDLVLLERNDKTAAIVIYNGLRGKYIEVTGWLSEKQKFNEQIALSFIKQIAPIISIRRK